MTGTRYPPFIPVLCLIVGRVRLGGRKLKYIINATGGTGTRGIRQPSPVPNGFSGTGTVAGGYPCLTGTYRRYPGNSIPVLHLSNSPIGQIFSPKLPISQPVPHISPPRSP